MNKEVVNQEAEKKQAQPVHKSARAALLAAQANFGDAAKDAENKHFGNSYATLKSLLDAVVPHLQAQGLLLSQPIVGSELGYSVKTVLYHPDSDSEYATDVPLLMAKQDMQQLKSASTYARRIGLENLTGISASDDDDDAEQNRSGTSVGASIRDAWTQGVNDTIPDNATPLQRATAFAKAICEDFEGKGEKALQNRWSKRKDMIGQFEQRFPNLHSQVVDAYELAMMKATGQD